MALSLEEGKDRRRAGLVRERAELTYAQRVQRGLVSGRPPASELRTPSAAFTAARTLRRELELRLQVEGMTPKATDFGVSIAYVTPDLSVLGYTLPFGTDEENNKLLDGNVLLGLVFGIVDSEAELEKTDRVVMGARAFITTKQVDGWLEELLPVVRGEIEHPQ